ncbi:MAG: hypothetical protein ACRBDL_00545 [Alphaproteobacteria bacterium]
MQFFLYGTVGENAGSGHIGFGGNVSGTFVPVPKKKPNPLALNIKSDRGDSLLS